MSLTNAPFPIISRTLITNSITSIFNLKNPKTKLTITSSFHQNLSTTTAVTNNQDEDEDGYSGGRSNYGGVRINESVDDVAKSRLDTWISSRIKGISRARVQSSIKLGLVNVNHRVVVKASHVVRHGDKVECTISELQPLKAEGEDIPLDIVYEDDHVLVVNKPAHMDEHSHAHLSQQFKQHTIERIYVSLTCGVPFPASGRVDIPIGRDLTNRIRMTADTGASKCGKSRHAASRYRIVEILAGGGCALVEWRLETGRTHQIRAHAKYLGIPLMGDDVYGGSKNMALSRLQLKNPSSLHGRLSHLVGKLDRPCLHALTLGFTHPRTREKMQFSCLPPVDFAEVLTGFRNISRETVKE